MRAIAHLKARRWLLGGRVQGVGFRPFVYRIAHRHHIEGWVRNLAGQVEILAQGDEKDLSRFAAALVAEAPPLARPEILSVTLTEPRESRGFVIKVSRSDGPAHIHVPPDQFLCEACVRELHDSRDRRHRYPFINCTQCGPRYTLIKRLPYDRANTTMATFDLCESCSAEYANMLDRRFHAEPIACPKCGPHVEFADITGELPRGDAALAACVAALTAGKVVAVKGVGGYHLMCDASNETAVALLRARKRRPDKPLAVMFPPDSARVDLRRAVIPTPDHEALLCDPMRPIVLIPKHPRSPLAAAVAPGCNEIGVMLPYSPLHHLLLKDFGGPLIATSANISGEPVLTDNDDVQKRLKHIADAFLHHNRPIARPADDPVYRVIAGKGRPIRIGRGSAPMEIELPVALPRPTLALGAHLKNTVAIGWDCRAVISPHLGDMDTPRGLALREQVAADLQALYGVTAETLLCDAHPGYATASLSRRWGLPVVAVHHHDAHASALAGEFTQPGDWLVFAWDGVGYGKDGSLWGGEALLGRPGQWRRFASFRPFSLPGGDRAAREPWRCALALRWEAGQRWVGEERDVELLRRAWELGLNCPRTSSVGRLFDAAAALLGLISMASHEAQGAMLLEAASSNAGEAIALPLARDADGVWRADWEPLLDRLMDSRVDPSARASLFHASLAVALVDQAKQARAECGVWRLGLTGGVFQNRLLCELVIHLAEQEGFTVHLPERIPCNDAGLSFGQLIEAGARI